MRSALLLLVLLIAACSTAPAHKPGVVDGRLAPCPQSPNCVSSFSTAEPHVIAPLQATLDQVKTVLAKLPRVCIVREDENYLHAAFTSPIMRFVDDVEFLYQPDLGLVQVRSASRVGYSDLGANRKRIEQIRAALTADHPPTP